MTAKLTNFTGITSKALFAFLVAFIASSSLMAQHNPTPTFGVYAGKADISIGKSWEGDFTPLSSTELTFEIAASSEYELFADIILKGYQLDGKTYKDIRLNLNSFELENNVWNIIQERSVDGKYETKDGNFSRLMSFYLEKGECRVTKDGTLELKIIVSLPTDKNDNVTYLTYVFKGKKLIANGISSIESLNKTVDAIYDLQGRRVASPTRGLYIVNGKKVVM